MAKERLDRFLANRGKGSRSEIKNIIRSGRVNVNGICVKSAEYKISEEDIVALDQSIVDNEKYVYIMLNKPAGTVSASHDKNDRTVIDILGKEYDNYKLFPVGRLDKDTVGLLILTNDGSFAHNSLSPAKHVEKRYIALVEGNVNENVIKKFREGIAFKDFTTISSELIIKEKSNGLTKAEVVIREGKYHQIKRMFEAVGCKVVYLKRTAFGEIHLDEKLGEGEYRPLSAQEKDYVRRVSRGGNDI